MLDINDRDHSPPILSPHAHLLFPSKIKIHYKNIAEAKSDTPNPSRNKNAAETVKTHIRLLHQYNEIRDIGSGLLGMIADNRGVRVGEVFEEYGVAGKD